MKGQLFRLEHYPLLDAVKGINTVGSEANLSEMLKIMMVEIPHNKAEIQKAHAVSDWDGVEKLAHKAKSGALYVGTLRIEYACQYLERYCKEGHSAVLLEKLYQQLLHVLDDTQKHLKDWLQKHNNA